MSNYNISRELLLSLFSELFSKDINNREHVINILFSTLDEDLIAMALDISRSSTEFNIKKPNCFIKYKANRFDQFDLFDVDIMQELGLYKDGFVFGRLSHKNDEDSPDKLSYPYSKYLYIDTLVIANPDKKIEDWKVEFTPSRDAKVIRNENLFPISKNSIPYYGKNKSRTT